MTKMRPIPFAEFREFLQKHGFVEKRVPKGRVFQHVEDEEGLLLFRYYHDDEPVFPRDLLSTRTFLDWRGILAADDYDQFLYPDRPPASKPRPVSFGELRALLQRLGFVEKRTRKGIVLQHPEAGSLYFALYRDEEPVQPHEIASARRLLDLRGILEADDFDATLLRANTPA